MSSPPLPSPLDSGDVSHSHLTATSASKRPSPTHFLCLPLYPQSISIFSNPSTQPSSLFPATDAHNTLKRSLKQFLLDEAESDERSVIEENAKIPRDAFRPYGTVHLTLGVMSLRDTDAVSKAVEVLNGVDLQSLLREAQGEGGVKLSDAKLLISLRGLRTMQSPKKTTVLYSHPSAAAGAKENEDVLYKFALSLREHFISNGLITPESRAFTLHATIINTIYSKSGQKKGGSRGRGRGGGKGRHGRGDKLVIDASDLLDKYHDKVFVEGLKIDRVEMCKMGARKGEEVVDEDGGTEIVGAGYEVIAWKVLSS